MQILYFISNGLLMINKINKSDKNDRYNKTKNISTNTMKGGNEEKTTITDEQRKQADERGPVPEYDNSGKTVFYKFVNIFFRN